MSSLLARWAAAAAEGSRLYAGSKLQKGPILWHFEKSCLPSQTAAGTAAVSQ